MPRVSPSILRKCDATNRFLRFLLPACKTVERSVLELKWISDELRSSGSLNVKPKLLRAIHNACVERSRLVPLQYILGSQPFGALNILCERGVLIPRWETEEWTHELADRIKNSITRPEEGLVIWDLCSGSGCIALLLEKELRSHCNLEVSALDCSARAISLIRKNMAHNSIKNVIIKKTDILNDPPEEAKIDILVCNPPYISKESFIKETSQSVKIYEPKLALIGDKEFYHNLVDYWMARVDSFVYEIGVIDQAKFVHEAVKKKDELNAVWSLGVKWDTNGRPRVVYGFKKQEKTRGLVNYNRIFDKFGELMH